VSARTALAALLVASTLLFAIGVAAESSSATYDQRAESAATESGEAGHDESTEQGSEGTVLGVDPESTAVVVVAVIVALALASAALTAIGRWRDFPSVVALLHLGAAAVAVRR
jgi:hypothetical protein